MTKSRRVPRPAPESAFSPRRASSWPSSWPESSSGQDWPSGVFSLGLTALLTATPLLPTESARTGSGLILIAGWLTLLLAWLVSGWFQSQLKCRWGWTEGAILVFLALHSVSAVLVTHHGQERSAINILWHWVSFGLAFFLTRQWLRTPDQQRALTSVLIASAVGLSAFGVYQYFVALPALRAEFRVDEDQVLRDAGVHAPPGSPERRQFADRLRSLEPTASFALTNSLAGVLVPWLMMLLALQPITRKERRLSTLAAGGLGLAVIGICLLLTKSRTGYLAAVVGMSLLLARIAVQQRRLNWRLPAAGLGVIVLILLAAIKAQGLDRRVITETSKAFGYRVEYWQSAWGLIRQQPWFGCGPGNFQQCYTAEKLPQASETVSDPHNFLLEVWSTAGTFAFVAFVLMGVVWTWQLRTLSRSSRLPIDERSVPEDKPSISSSTRPSRAAVLYIYAGGLLGVGVAAAEGLFASMLPDLLLVALGVPAASLVVVLLHPWVRSGSLPRYAPVIAVVALSINLLAAGGIGYPGVALSWWVLSALALNGATEWDAGVLIHRGWLAIGCVGVLVLCGGFYQTMYLPVLEHRRYMFVGLSFQEQGHYLAAVGAYQAAAAADRRSPEPWTQLAALHQQAALAQASPVLLERFGEAADQALERDPQSHALHRRVGDMYLELHAKTNQRSLLNSAIQRYDTATALYPNSNILHAQLAWALSLAGDKSRAQTEAEIALQLDGLNPHAEQKLSAQPLFDPHHACQTGEKAEPAMLRLRRELGPKVPD